MHQFGPSQTMSLGGNYYGLVKVVYCRYTWTLFIVTKEDTFTTFKRLGRVLQNANKCSISAIKIVHWGEF